MQVYGTVPSPVCGLSATAILHNRRTNIVIMFGGTPKQIRSRKEQVELDPITLQLLGEWCCVILHEEGETNLVEMRH